MGSSKKLKRRISVSMGYGSSLTPLLCCGRTLLPCLCFILVNIAYEVHALSVGQLLLPDL